MWVMEPFPPEKSRVRRKTTRRSEGPNREPGPGWGGSSLPRRVQDTACWTKQKRGITNPKKGKTKTKYKEGNGWAP